MAKTNVTTAAMSGNLKTGMIAIGNYPQVGDYDTFYDAQNNIWCVQGMHTAGLLRCIGKSNEFTDLFLPNDPEMVRAWSMEELTQWFVNTYAYDNYTESQQGQNFTISFDVGGQSFSGTENRRVNAFAEAIIDLLASPVAVSAMRSAGQAKTASAAPKTSSKKKKNKI